MLSYRTQGFNGYAVQYSPFFDNKLAVATASNYGLVGNGRLYVLDIALNGQLGAENYWETQDGVFDVAWSEIHENQCAVASGDGSVKLFDRKVPQFPVMNWKEHSREVFSVNWNLVDKTNFVSSSWDGTIKVWTPNRQQSLMTLDHQVDYTTKAAPVASTARPPVPMTPQNRQNGTPASTANCVYNATFSPHSPSTIISSNGLSRVQIWDLRSHHPLQIDYVAHGGLEALTCDWNKYKPTIVASGGTDKSVRIWDLRMITKLDQPHSSSPMPAYHLRGPSPLNELLGHEFAVRKVVFSPHDAQELLSTSYDMTCRVWRDMSDERARFLNVGQNACKGVFNAHKEFTIGCDYSLWGEPGWVSTVGWDQMVYVWDTKRVLR